MDSPTLSVVPDRGQDVALAGIKLASQVVQNKNRQSSVVTPIDRPKEFHTDVALPGMKLEDYTKRVPSEDGLTVHIVQHKEWLEKIPQPPTPQEIAEAKAQRKKENRIVAGVLTGAALLFGGFIFYDVRQRRNTVEVNK